ncbi:hypothetical protein, partial [Streptomyces sp. NPDC051563]|uniref:hypothetical protein n=1 Tax=Streptomyces sp. NPDC051563 TaxID=3365659 RepID=UPI0037AEAFF1
YQLFGVDFWHAVEFSRNGRFLCTHPLGLSSGLRSVLFLRFRLYQSLSRLFPAFQVIRFRVFPFRRFQLYQIISVSFPTWI